MHFDYLLSWGVGELSCINISILSKEWDGGGSEHYKNKPC